MAGWFGTFRHGLCYTAVITAGYYCYYSEMFPLLDRVRPADLASTGNTGSSSRTHGHTAAVAFKRKEAWPSGRGRG